MGTAESERAHGCNAFLRNDSPPRPIPDLRVTDFKEGLYSFAKEAETYLIHAGSKSFVVSAQVAALVRLLNEGPDSYSTLTSRYNAVVGDCLRDEDLKMIVEAKLPREIFAADNSSRRSPFLIHFELLKSAWLSPLTSRLAWMFNVWVGLGLLVALVAVELATFSDSAASVHNPLSLVQASLLFAGFFLSMILHELGHLSACARGGGKHGGIGAGLYWYFPALYSEVSQAWELPPAARVLVDVGGIYFQSFALVGIGCYACLSGSQVALQLCWAINFAMLNTLNPVFKFDGYWLLSDAAGITNLHKQMRAAFIDGILRIFGHKLANWNPGKARGILAVYCVLAAAYFAFVMKFIYRELMVTLPSLPSRVASVSYDDLVSLHAGDYLTATSRSMHLLLICLWPLILSVVSVLIIRMIGRSFVSLVEAWKNSPSEQVISAPSSRDA